MQNIHEIENVLNSYELKKYYKMLINANSWSINSAYGEGIYSNFYPMFRVMYEDDIYNPFWFGFFSGIVSSINSRLQKEKGFNLGGYEIKNIILNASQDVNKFHFHEHRDFRYVIVGFLTPEWDESWGGELGIEEKKIKFKPGNFVLFSGHNLHDAMPVKINLPFWRISVGIFLK